MFKKIFSFKNRSKKEKKFYTKDIINDINIKVGDFTYGAPKILKWNKNSFLEIGKFCSIAEGVKIFLDGNHHTDWITTYPFSVLNKSFPKGVNIKGHPTSNGPVFIGNDVWIGSGSIILSGVKIGDGAVIGANTVVSKDIPPYTIVAGNPVKIIRKRFEDEIIDKLLIIQWWNWPIEKINSEVKDLCSPQIQTFVNRHFRKSDSHES